MNQPASSAASTGDGKLPWPGYPAFEFDPTDPLWQHPRLGKLLATGGEDPETLRDPAWLYKRLSEEIEKRAKDPNLPRVRSIEEDRAEIAERRRNVPALPVQYGLMTPEEWAASVVEREKTAGDAKKDQGESRG